MPRKVSRSGFSVKGVLLKVLKKTNDKCLSIRIRIAIMVAALPLLDTFRTFLRSPSLDFRLQFQAFQDGARAA